MAPSSRLAYLLLLALVFAIPWEEAVVLPGIGSVARLIGIAAFLLALIGLFRGGVVHLRRPSLLLVLSVLYLAWTAATTFWSIDSEVTVASLKTLAQLLLMVWLVWQLCPGPRHERGLAQAFVLGAYVTAINILWIFFLQSDAIRIDGRIASAGANQNDVAAALALAIPFAWQLLLHHRRGRPFWLWLNVLFVPVAIAAIVLTGSRGGIVAACTALLVVPLSYFQLRTRVQLLVLSTMLVLGAAVVVVPNQLIERATPNFIRLSSVPEDLAGGNLSGRLVIWQAGFEVLQDRPVVGYGAGAFRTAIRPILGEAWAPHNTFLAVAVGTGLVGLSLFVLILLSVGVPLLVAGGPRSSVPIVLFLALMISILPLGWEGHKITWFVLAYLAAVRGLELSNYPTSPRPRGAGEKRSVAIG